MTIRLQHSVIAVAVCAFCFSGCSQTSSLLNFNKIAHASAKDPVIEILGLWEPADGRGPDGKPRRGCAGQILFMTRGQQGPVRIDGSIVIHQFDDVGTPEEQAKPLHTFRFDTGSWTNHFAEGSLGPSYSVFIPYMRDSPYKTLCALRIQYTSVEGKIVHSSIAKINLPGPERKPLAAKSDSAFESISMAATPPIKKKLKSQRLAILDGTGLKTIREKSTEATTASRNFVQHASWQTESTDDRHVELNDMQTKKIAELENKLANMRNEPKQEHSTRSARSSRSTRFRTAADTRNRFRMSGRNMAYESDNVEDDE
jgi:hypothetical protein